MDEVRGEDGKKPLPSYIKDNVKSNTRSVNTYYLSRWGSNVSPKTLLQISFLTDLFDVRIIRLQSIGKLLHRNWYSSTSNQIFKKKAAKEEEKFYNAYEKDVAIVNFYFESTTCFEFVRNLRKTWTDFISDLGGILGLCMGISFVSAVELLYWLTIRMADNIYVQK